MSQDVKQVLVTNKRSFAPNTFFSCRHDKTGWRCGWCLRGLVKPKIRSRCKVCKAFVKKVVR